MTPKIMPIGSAHLFAVFCATARIGVAEGGIMKVSGPADPMIISVAGICAEITGAGIDSAGADNNSTSGR